MLQALSEHSEPCRLPCFWSYSSPELLSACQILASLMMGRQYFQNNVVKGSEREIQLMVAKLREETKEKGIWDVEWLAGS